MHVKQKYYGRWNERDTFSDKHVISLYFFNSLKLFLPNKYMYSWLSLSFFLFFFLSFFLSLSLSLFVSLNFSVKHEILFSLFLSLSLSLSQKFSTKFPRQVFLLSSRSLSLSLSLCDMYSCFLCLTLSPSVNLSLNI